MSWTVQRALAEAGRQLDRASESPRADAEMLLAHVLGIGRAQLFARLDEALDERTREEFEQLVARRVREEPVAYLTGVKGFWTLQLKVSPDVLVPRPETELVVEWALQLVGPLPAPAIADLGTGSGAIALALAAERPDARVVATDVSAAALAVARRNAQDCGLRNVELREGSWLTALGDDRFDLVASNPPYVAGGDVHLQALRHEPLLALTDGAGGLNALREIVAGAPAHVRDGGWLVVEHGFEQGAAVRTLFAEAGFEAVTTRRDLGGHERATAGRRGAMEPGRRERSRSRLQWSPLAAQGAGDTGGHTAASGEAA